MRLFRRTFELRTFCIIITSFLLHFPLQVIPIEGSMAENRGRYPCYLHISLFLLSSILGSFGVLGYLRYGAETNQIVTENLNGSVIVIALRCLLFFGVLFTYPLQIYPVIQIVEALIFGPNSSCGRRLYRQGPAVNGGFDGSTSDELEGMEHDVTTVVKVNEILSELFFDS